MNTVKCNEILPIFLLLLLHLLESRLITKTGQESSVKGTLVDFHLSLFSNLGHLERYTS